MPRVSRLGVGGGLNHLCEVEVPEEYRARENKPIQLWI